MGALTSPQGPRLCAEHRSSVPARPPGRYLTVAPPLALRGPPRGPPDPPASGSARVRGAARAPKLPMARGAWVRRGAPPARQPPSRRRPTWPRAEFGQVRPDASWEGSEGRAGWGTAGLGRGRGVSPHLRGRRGRQPDRCAEEAAIGFRPRVPSSPTAVRAPHSQPA